jgi:hypothetical protein
MIYKDMAPQKNSLGVIVATEYSYQVLHNDPNSSFRGLADLFAQVCTMKE